MDLNDYVSSVNELIESLKELYPRTTTLQIGAATNAAGVIIGTELSGAHERLGYTLEVKYEYFNLKSDGTIRRKYRYRIRRGKDELIRFQSDKNNFPENAHFPPHYLVEHYQISKWPAEMRDMCFPIFYKLFTDIVRADGDLPEPFRSAKP